jgi:hypothetical protein
MDKLKLYEFYWCDYAVDNYFLFYNLSNPTQEQFVIDCKRAMKESFNEYMSKFDGLLGLDYWISFSVPKLIDYGYIEFDKASFGYGGGSIISECDLTDIIGKDFPDEVKKAVEYNKKLYNESDEEE